VALVAYSAFSGADDIAACTYHNDTILLEEYGLIRYLVLVSVIASFGFSILAYVIEGEAAFQSGLLLQGHASADEACQKCHDPWGSVSNEKCKACHLFQFERDPDHGKEKPRCADCHLDHRGRNFDIITTAKKLKEL